MTQTEHKNTMITQKTICNKENGQVIEFQEYTNGKLTVLEKYHPNGNLRYYKTPTEESYFNQKGEAHGPHIEYNEDGNIIRKESYIKGTRHGIQFTYYQRFKSVIHSIDNYYYGAKDGIQLGLYPSGKLCTKITYVKGKATTNITFTPDGELYKTEIDWE